MCEGVCGGHIVTCTHTYTHIWERLLCVGFNVCFVTGYIDAWVCIGVCVFLGVLGCVLARVGVKRERE